MRNSRARLNKLWDELQSLEDTYGAPIALFLAFLLIVIIGIPTARDVLSYWDDIENGKRAEAGIILLQTVATVIGGIAIFWNIVLSRKQMSIAQRQMKIAQDQMITDMLSRAIEQLGHEQSSVRIGAIYSLERIARESKQEHCSVVEIISSFVRDNSHLDSVKTWTEKSMPGRDIQAAIIVLGRREIENDKNPIYLTNTNLMGIDFSCGSQVASNFGKSDLSFSDLFRSNFFDTNLEKANFYQANLKEAKLRKANLRGAYLCKADLKQANLREADLSNADLSDANLVGVKNLRVEQVKLARNWEKAIYDSDFRKLL